MKKTKLIISVLSVIIIMAFSVFLTVKNENALNNINKIKFEEVDMNSLSTSTNMIINKENDVISEDKAIPLQEVSMDIVPATVIREEVYAGLTMEELAAKFDRLLGSGYMQGKGYLIASYSLEKGVDPYVALAIILHETGCGGTSSCSKLVVTCNNVGGQKGSPGCNGGAYKSFPTLDDGIKGFIDNLYRNYYAVGLTTIDSIAPKYAEGSTWSSKIHWYVNKISNS